MIREAATIPATGPLRGMGASADTVERHGAGSCGASAVSLQRGSLSLALGADAQQSVHPARPFRGLPNPSAPASFSPLAINVAERIGQTSARPDLGDFTFNVMAPLVVGDANDMDSPESLVAWRAFDTMLQQAKAHGAESVSTDVWWGLIEPEDNQFDWSYYDRVADAVERAGLCWVPILSFHQCGGNIGDDADVPIPGFLRDKYARLSSDGPEGAFFKSEQHNVSYESISVWASTSAGGEYEDVMRAFQAHFADRAHNISEINVSLGPAGELRYPSYNSLDQGCGYPTRGALQSYSALAMDSFRAFLTEKYGSLDGINDAWGSHLSDMNEVRPPDDAAGFFGRADDKNTRYGRDFFDWYNDSLVEHGRRILTTAVDVFNGPNAAFDGIDLGAKIPGVHWRTGTDRSAELAAGLIRSSEALTDWTSDREGHGYDDMIRLFRDVQQLPHAPKMVMHFTCLEMDDGAGGHQVASRAKSLVRWIANAAREYGVVVKGENALPVSSDRGWQNIDEAMADGYEGLTVLRLPLDPHQLDQLSRLSGKYP